jgi:hypothetical protein
MTFLLNEVAGARAGLRCGARSAKGRARAADYTLRRMPEPMARGVISRCEATVSFPVNLIHC